MNGLDRCKHGRLRGLCCGADGYGPAKQYSTPIKTSDTAQFGQSSDILGNVHAIDTSTEHGQMDSKNRQVGGGHYVRCDIQPVEYALANKFNYCESFALKYLTRHRHKNGIEDLRKAIHCIELLIEAEYGHGPKGA